MLSVLPGAAWTAPAPAAPSRRTNTTVHAPSRQRASPLTFCCSIARDVRVPNPSAVKSEPFECGQSPFSLPGGKLAIKFYLTAILFILFDVELVFLYPWAVVYRQLGMLGLVEMGVFLGILMVGYVYAWDNGALKWH